MLNKILPFLWSSFVAVLLIINVEVGFPFSGELLLADHTLDHPATVSEEMQQSASQLTSSPQIETSATLEQTNEKDDRLSQKEPTQPAQADPSVPYDPYDFDVIRQIDREIYGEIKGNDEK